VTDNASNPAERNNLKMVQHNNLKLRAEIVTDD